MGAIALARRFALPGAVGLIVAALPIALNWSAVSRRGEPEAGLPRELAAILLDGLPPRAVLFVAGDNDSYPLWYAQQVEGRRRDVTVVTIPLLAAPWYVEELGRRHQLVVTLPAGDVDVVAGAVANAARAGGRPVAVALTVPPTDRSHLSQSWRVLGLVAVDESPTSNGATARPLASVSVDSAATRAIAGAIDAWRRGRSARPAVDPTNEYFMNVLSCPGLIVASRPSKVQLTSRDSICNLPDRK
jgi:hypothetical protein